MMFLTQSVSPNAMFSVAEKAHSQFHSGQAVITVDARTGAVHEKTRYRFDLSGSSVSMQITEIQKVLRLKSNRVFRVDGNKFLGWDLGTNEYLSRRLEGKGNVYDKFEAAIGQLDDPVKVILNPSGMQTFLKPFRSMTGFKVKKLAGGAFTLERSLKSKGKFATTILEFNQRHLLKHLLISTNASRLEWGVSYGGASVQSPPKNFKKVTSLSAPIEPMKYFNAHSKEVVESMFKAYGRLRQGIIRVESGTATSRLVLDGKMLREETETLIWAFNGKTLSVKSPANFYRGSTQRPLIPDYIAALGGRVDPLVRQMIVHAQVGRDLIVPGASIKSTGRINLGSVACDIVEARTPGNRTTAFIRADNHLLYSISVEVLDRNGNAMYRNEKRYTYEKLGVPQSAREFTLTPASGQKVMSLPSISLQQ